MKRTLLLLLAGCLLLGGLCLWAATEGTSPAPTELKPVAIVSVAGYDKLLGDVAFVGKLAKNPDLGAALESLLKLVTKSQGLDGLDKTRPWGAMVQTDGSELTGCAFVPVTDLTKLTGAIEPLIGKVEEIGGGVFKINHPKATFYAKVTEGWVFLAPEAEMLEHTPADPSDLVKDLNTSYDAAVRLYVANIPERHREAFFEKLKNDAKRDAAQRPGESERLCSARRTIIEQIVPMVVSTVNDLDAVTLGWELDTSSAKTCVEISVTAKEGTATANSIDRKCNAKSLFSGFRMPDAALTGNWVSDLPEQKAALLSAVIEAIRVQATERIIKNGKRVEEGVDFVAHLASLAQETVKNGHLDGGMALLLQPDSATAVFGGQIADGAKLTKAIQVIAKVASEEIPPAKKWIKLDAEEYKSIHFHTISIPVPPDAKDHEKIVKLVGEKLEVVVGVGPQSAFFAIGREPLKALKQAIDGSAAGVNKTVPPLEISLSLKTLATFIAAVGRDDQRPKAALIANLLADSAGHDHVNFTAEPIPNGVKCRIELEDGILKMLGQIATLTSAAMNAWDM